MLRDFIWFLYHAVRFGVGPAIVACAFAWPG